MLRACVAAILVATAAHAFVPGRVIDTDRARVVDETRIGAWHATRDRGTGTITQLWGSYVAAPGAVANAAVAEGVARTFLAHHALPAGTRIEDFVVVANRVDRGKRTVAFAQTWNGMRVIGGQMHVVFANDRLFYAASDAFPNVIALAPRTANRVIVPIVGTGRVEYRVASVRESRLETVYQDDAGTPIARTSRAHHASSTLRLDVGVRYASGPRELRPAALLDVTVDGNATRTGTDGSFTWADGPTTLVTGTTGPEVRIIDESGTSAVTSLPVQAGTPVTWSGATSERIDAQISAYAYVTAAKAAARRIDPDLAWTGNTINVHVNVDEVCNALSAGDDLFFYRANASCENTARVADIVHHEVGHSFHGAEVIPGAGGMDASIMEGVADFFAANITGDSGIGRGLAYDDQAVRELDPVGSERVYPRDLTAVSHYTGLIIGGALWDLREQLIAKLGEAPGIAAAERIFLGILQRAGDLTKTYAAARVTDDDDGDLGNGTPNGCVLESAFGRHGLAGSEFRETRLVPPVVEGTQVSVAVDTPAAGACPRATVTAMMMRVRDGDVVPMSESAGAWRARLPDVPDGTVLAYQIAATLDTGETLLLPENPADPYYQHYVGATTEVWCEHFDADPAWLQTGATEWDFGVAKAANTGAGDPAVAFAGASWLGTDLVGNGRYRSDILTSIETPAIKAASWGNVRLQFRRWLAIEDAALDVATIRINGTQIWANASNPTFSLDHVDREWRFVDFDITEYAREPISVAFTLASDAYRELGGWNLDEVCIVATDKRPVCGDGVVDPGEACDGEPGCDKPCERDGAGCCSASEGAPWSSLVLAQFVMIFVFRRASRRRPSRSVSERMP